MDNSVKKVGALIAKHFHLHLKGEMSVKGLVGCTALVCAGIAGYQQCQKEPDTKVKKTCGVASVLLGGVFLFMDEKEQKKVREKYEHEERMVKIKHGFRKVSENMATSEFCDEGTSNINEDTPFETYKPSEAFTAENALNPMLGTALPEGFDALVYAPKGSMKSYFVLGTMAQIALSEKPMALPPELNCAPPENVFCIYADGENGKAVINNRLSSFGTRLDGAMEIIGAKQFGNTLDQLFAFIKSICFEKRTGTRILLGVDNMKSMFKVSSTREVKSYLNGLKTLRSELESVGITLTTVTIHHTNKSRKQASGSGDITDLLPYVFRLDKKGNLVQLTIEESRTRQKGAVYNLKIVRKPYIHLVYDNTVSTPEDDNLTYKEKRKVQYERVKAMRDSSIPWKDITATTGVSQQRFNNWKNQFESE